MLKSKRAEMGIGTLIIFISLLLVAAIAAGVLIQTAGSLQEKALMTGDQAKGQIATNIRVVEVSATDGRNGTVKQFTYIAKLASGSEPIKLAQSVFTMNTYDRTATLKYAGTGANFTNSAGGYYTWDIETVTNNSDLGNDYDRDGQADNTRGGSDGALAYLNLSSGIHISLGMCAASVWTPNLNNTNYVDAASGSCSGNNMTQVTLTPTNESQGVFSVEYLQQGNNWVDGNLQRGDVVKFYFEAPRDIDEDEQVRLNFIPKIGTPTLTEFITPEVIAEERIYLYP
jgi:archaellin